MMSMFLNRGPDGISGTFYCYSLAGQLGDGDTL